MQSHGKSYYLRDLQKGNFPDRPEIFPLFFRFSDNNSEDDEAKSCPRVNSEHILAKPRHKSDRVKFILPWNNPKVCNLGELVTTTILS